MNYIDDLVKRYPVLSLLRNDIEKICDVLEKSVRNGGKILICGNGGSASDAEHIVGELMKEFVKNRPLDETVIDKIKSIDNNPQELIENIKGAIPAIALSAHSALSTALINDCDPDMVFAQQVFGYARENDVLIALSTSGNSKNIVNAARVAKVQGVISIAITGANGGVIKGVADYTLSLPETETYLVQELTLPLYHTICLELENRIF